MERREALEVDEVELVSRLARKLTGAYDDGKRRDVLVANVLRRMNATGALALDSYLRLARDDEAEYVRLLSALTIHTTSWFREKPHFDAVATLAPELWRRAAPSPMRVLSAACSSGEEPYSLALCLERLRADSPKEVDYRVDAFDIDFMCINTARRAIYPAAEIARIPAEFRAYLRVGSERTAGLFTLAAAVRERCRFLQANLLGLEKLPEPTYHLIFCRNVMIYFSREKAAEIVRSLAARLAPGGLLALGHSEAIDAAAIGLRGIGHALYRNTKDEEAKAAPRKSPRRARRPEILLAGASTGGTEALLKAFVGMPRNSPPLLVVQHISPSFARSFAARLAEVSGLTLAEPVDGARLLPGHLYMALGDYHIGVRAVGRDLVLALSTNPRLHGVRPSVDHLFGSVAALRGFPPCAAVLLTGMGKDGARGLGELAARDCHTFAQDEATSVVFGMPREAIERGAAGVIGSPEAIRRELGILLNTS